MNISNLAPDPELFMQQMAQMTEQLNNSQAGDWPEGAQVKNVSNVAFEFDTTAIAEEFGVFVDNTPLGAATPHLKAPNEQIMLEPTTGEQIAAALESMGLDKPPEVQSFAGVTIESPMLQQLAQFQPLTKLAILEMGEEKLLQELTAYFDAKGMSVPQNPEDAVFKQAMFDIFNERMDNSSAIMPEELTHQLQDSLLLLGDSVQYLEFAANIQAPAISAANNPHVKQGLQMLESMEEMLGASIEELQQNGTSQQQSGGVLEYMKNMMDMLRDVKMAMYEAQMSETSKSQEMMLAKKEAIHMRTQLQLKEFKKQEMQMEKQEQMKVFQDTIEILMPCMQILFIILSLVFLPLAPMMILLAVIVSIALISIQIALTEEGVMDSAFENINTFAASLFSFVGDEDLAELLFWVLAIVAILVIAVLLIMVPGVAAVVPAIAGTIIGWIVSHSGIVDTITVALKDITGWDDDWADVVYGALAGMSISFLANGVMMIAGMIRQLIEELLKVVVELAMQLIELVITLVATILEMGIKILIELGKKLMEGGVSAITTLLKNAIKLLISAIKTVMKVFVKILSQILAIITSIICNMLKTALSFVTDILKSAISLAVNAIKTVFKSLVKALDAMLEILMDVLTKIIEEIIGVVVDLIAQIFYSVINLLKWMIDMVRQITEMFFGLLKNNLLKLIQISGTAQAASFKELQARLAESMGIAEAEISALDEVIRTIDQDVQKSMGRMDSAGVGEFMEVVNDITKFIEKMLSSRSRVIGDLVATAMA